MVIGDFIALPWFLVVETGWPGRTDRPPALKKRLPTPPALMLLRRILAHARIRPCEASTGSPTRRAPSGASIQGTDVTDGNGRRNRRANRDLQPNLCCGITKAHRMRHGRRTILAIGAAAFLASPLLLQPGFAQ
jgi:hypothetical protein